MASSVTKGLKKYTFYLKYLDIYLEFSRKAPPDGALSALKSTQYARRDARALDIRMTFEMYIYIYVMFVCCNIDVI